MTATLRLAIALGAIGVAAFVGLRTDASKAASSATWRLDPPASEGAIEGYSSKVSVESGKGVELHVSTRSAARYRIEVFRIGWYGGSGAAPVACEPLDCTSDREGVEQAMPPVDPSSGETRASWQVTDTIATSPEWRSGYYLAKLILTTGPERGSSAGVPFVLRTISGSATGGEPAAGTSDPAHSADPRMQRFVRNVLADMLAAGSSR